MALGRGSASDGCFVFTVESSFLVCCELGGKKKKKEKNSSPKINFNFKPVKLTELEMYTLPLSNLHCSAVFCMKRRFWSSS